MSLKQKCKFHLIAGAHVKMYAAGMEFEGTVITAENNLNPNDGHVSLDLVDGNLAILPLNNQTTFVLIKSDDEKEKEDEDELDDEAVEDKPIKKAIDKKVSKKK